MIDFSDSFIIPCSAPYFIHHFIHSFHIFINSSIFKNQVDHYNILSSYIDNNIYYRKAYIHKKNVFPSSLLYRFPKHLIEACYHHIEEVKYIKNDVAFTWRVYPNTDEKLFHLHGKTSLDSINDHSSLLTISFHFEIDNLINIKNYALRFLIFNIIEKQIPSLIFSNLKNIYISFCKFIQQHNNI